VEDEAFVAYGGKCFGFFILHFKLWNFLFLVLCVCEESWRILGEDEKVVPLGKL
jgi:hypothetical protein